ncbi:MAG: type II toxin-antitoxin system VapC family toxin [Balneolaceae bacterium]|nr:type II toxin-antitoxin system VapC family toxin [Balneolaceae bacterium]
MNDLVVDASVAIKWLFREKGSEEAEQIIKRISLFYVPLIFPVEMDSVITKKVRRKELQIDESCEKRKQVRKLPFKIEWDENVSQLAFEVAISLPVTYYDATYLATAIEKYAMFVTADRKLVNGISKTSLEDYIIYFKDCV